VKERPILFSAPMVRAILAGAKTVTRRIVSERSPHWIVGERNDGVTWLMIARDSVRGATNLDDDWLPMPCPYGDAGDRLRVRETWRTVERKPDMVDGILFRADDAFVPIENTRAAADRWIDAHDNGKHSDRWRPSIFLPTWASRIHLEVTDVRIERLHAIDEHDAFAEGVSGWVLDPRCETARDGFRVLWDEINGAGAWKENPWVWRVGFRRLP